MDPSLPAMVVGGPYCSTERWMCSTGAHSGMMQHPQEVCQPGLTGSRPNEAGNISTQNRGTTQWQRGILVVDSIRLRANSLANPIFFLSAGQIIFLVLLVAGVLL